VHDLCSLKRSNLYHPATDVSFLYGSNRVGVSTPHLRIDTDPVSEILCSFVCVLKLCNHDVMLSEPFRIYQKMQSPFSKREYKVLYNISYLPCRLFKFIFISRCILEDEYIIVSYFIDLVAVPEMTKRNLHSNVLGKICILFLVNISSVVCFYFIGGLNLLDTVV
jgi:hypothetical protein